jgi:hypothetical protein
VRPEELQLGMPPAPPPAPVQSMPPPVAAPAGPVTAARGGPGQQIKQYDADLLGTANQRIDLAGQQGREESATFERRAGLRGEQATRARAELEDAKGRVEEGRGREREKRDEADRLYEELKANAKPPGKKGIEQVMGIIGSVMAMGGGNRGMAQGAQMLGSLLGSDREGWAAEQDANSNLYRSALAGIESERGGQSHDLDIASRIAALDAHYYDAALEQAKEMGLSEEAKRVATGLQLDMRDKATTLLRNNAVAQQKAQAGAGRNAAEDYFWKLPFDQLRQMPTQVMGETGAKVLKERTAIEGGLKKLDEPGKEPGANLSADERKMQRLLTGVTPSVTNLRQKLASGGDVPHPWAEHLPELVRSEDALNLEADIQSVADILLRDESGAAIGKDEQEKKKKGWGITSGDPEVRRRGLEKMLSEYDSRLGSVGAPAQAAPPAGGAAAPDPRVRSGFAAPSAASKGVSTALPPSGVTMDQVAAQAAQQDEMDAASDQAQALLAQWQRR